MHSRIGRATLATGWAAAAALMGARGGLKNVSPADRKSAARRLVRTGDFDAARALLVEAMQTADEMGERMYVPQLLLLDAAIARAQGRADDARAATRRAIEEAQQQQAPWLELEARVDFCEYDAATASERAALAALVDGLPQAGDTPLIQRARALLQTS